MMKIAFLKMQGTGNDFVVLDGRAQPIEVNADMVKRLADRHFGIGCDQLVVLRPSREADVAMRLFNADGSEIATCGNATRCVADVVMRESGKEQASIETQAGIRTGWRTGSLPSPPGGGPNLHSQVRGGGAKATHGHPRESARADSTPRERGVGREDDVTVNMGAPKLAWREIPLSESRNTLHLGLEEGLLFDPVGVSMGNPHMVFFVRDLARIKLGEWGPKLERHPLFPERANVSAVQVIDEAHAEMIVWERGAGLTLACGSAACAAVVAGVQRGVLARSAAMRLPGGTLHITWENDKGELPGDVLMRGPVAYVFEGTIGLD